MSMTDFFNTFHYYELLNARHVSKRIFYAFLTDRLSTRIFDRLNENGGTAVTRRFRFSAYIFDHFSPHLNKICIHNDRRRLTPI